MVVGFMMVMFLFLVFIGFPISFGLLLPSIIYIFIEGLPIKTILIRLINEYNSFILLAIPFFILAGKVMNKAKISDKLVSLADLFVGFLKGGLAHVNIVVSMFFGGCTGTAISDTTAVGSILIPAMKKEGYEADFSAAVTAASSTMGPIIPPSIMFIVYGAMAGVSIGDLFLAGAIPGILIGVGQMLLVAYLAHKHNYPRREEKLGIKKSLKIFKDGILPMMLPIIILGGIIFGFATPTEAAVTAAVYAIFLAVFVYKTISFKGLLKVITEAGIDSGRISILIVAASLFGWIMVMEDIPASVATFLLDSGLPNIVILLLINIFLLIVGMFIDSFPAIIMITPVFLPIYRMLGLSLLHAGVFSSMILIIGVITPPVGCCLFAASSIANVPYEKVAVKILPFLAVNVAITLLVTYVPQIVTFLPALLK